MGVDCKIYIPSDVRLKDLVKAMGVAAGFSKTKRACGNSFYVVVEGIKVEVSASQPECPVILFQMYTIDGQKNHHVMFHTECSGQHGKYKLLMPPSTPFWIAMGKKIVTLFGGWIDYDDCDDKEVDFRKRKPRTFNDPEDGVEWDELQQAIWDIKPITQHDLFDIIGVASYKVGIGVNLEEIKAKDKAIDDDEKKEALAFEDMTNQVAAKIFEDND